MEGAALQGTLREMKECLWELCEGGLEGGGSFTEGSVTGNGMLWKRSISVQGSIRGT